MNLDKNKNLIRLSIPVNTKCCRCKRVIQDKVRFVYYKRYNYINVSLAI